MEKIIEIANFQQVERAELLASLLRSEGIDCYVRNEASTRAFGGLIDIGARVELLESDLPRALEIMNDCGYFQPEDEPAESLTCRHTGLAHRIPFPGKFSFEKQIVILIVLICGMIALLVYLGAFLSAPKY